MNYKKLIREALGLELFFNLNKEEKFALNFLHKRYKDINYDFQLITNDMVNELEDLGFNFTTSIKLASLYKNNRDKLFKDYHEKYYELNESKIVHAALTKYLGQQSDETKLRSMFTERFKTSSLAKKFGDENFFLSFWSSSYSDDVSFYVLYSTLTSNNKWKCIVKYDFTDLSKKSGDINSIPFTVTIKGIEHDFPIPELEGSTDTIEIPINFNVENITRNDVYEIVFGEKNSLVSDLDERLIEIMSINN
jgi:hypothetical protein